MPAASRYLFNDIARRWKDRATGRFVPEKAVGQARENAVQRTARKFNAATARRAAGELTTREWRAEMLREIKRGHLVATATAHGGWNNVPPEAWLRTGRRILKEQRHLNTFTRLLDRRRVTTEGRKFKARARSYIANMRVAYEAEKDNAARNSPVPLEERWIYGGAEDHCPGCSKQRKRGWVAAGTLPAIGTQDCLWFCKCTKIRRVAAARRVSE